VTKTVFSLAPLRSSSNLSRPAAVAGNREMSGELSEEIGSQFGFPIDMSRKMGGLRTIAGALNAGNIARAQMATLFLDIPDPPRLSKMANAPDEMIKFIRELHWSGMIKADWDPDEHPRWPAGAPDSQGGRFAPKGEGGNSGTAESDATGGSARIQLAEDGISDASNDPVAEAAAGAATRRKPSSTSSLVNPARNEDFWETLGSRISHEATTAISEIGQTRLNENTAERAFATTAARAIASGLKDYAHYRAQPWIGADGKPVQVPAIDISDPFSELAALVQHELLTPNAPLTRPGTNADWIDPLATLVSVGAPFAGPALRVLGTGAQAAADATTLAADTPFIILPSDLAELPAAFDTTLPMGKFPIPENLVPGTKAFGDYAHDQIGRLLQDAEADTEHCSERTRSRCGSAFDVCR
jgi:hypothetical protein